MGRSRRLGRRFAQPLDYCEAQQIDADEQRKDGVLIDDR